MQFNVIAFINENYPKNAKKDLEIYSNSDDFNYATDYFLKKGYSLPGACKKALNQYYYTIF